MKISKFLVDTLPLLVHVWRNETKAANAGNRGIWEDKMVSSQAAGAADSARFDRSLSAISKNIIANTIGAAAIHKLKQSSNLKLLDCLGDRVLSQ